jgi:hypothetical protein
MIQSDQDSERNYINYGEVLKPCDNILDHIYIFAFQE